MPESASYSALLSGTSSSWVWPTMCTGWGRSRRSGAKEDTPESMDSRGVELLLELLPLEERGLNCSVLTARSMLVTCGQVQLLIIYICIS